MCEGEWSRCLRTTLACRHLTIWMLVVAEPQDQEEDKVSEGVRASTFSFPVRWATAVCRLHLHLHQCVLEGGSQDHIRCAKSKAIHKHGHQLPRSARTGFIGSAYADPLLSGTGPARLCSVSIMPVRAPQLTVTALPLLLVLHVCHTLSQRIEGRFAFLAGPPSVLLIVPSSASPC